MSLFGCRLLKTRRFPRQSWASLRGTRARVHLEGLHQHMASERTQAGDKGVLPILWGSIAQKALSHIDLQTMGEDLGSRTTRIPDNYPFMAALTSQVAPKTSAAIEKCIGVLFSVARSWHEALATGHRYKFWNTAIERQQHGLHSFLRGYGCAKLAMTTPILRDVRTKDTEWHRQSHRSLMADGAVVCSAALSTAAWGGGIAD